MSQGNFQTYKIPGKQHLTLIVVKKQDLTWVDARRCIRQIGTRRVIRLIPTTRCAIRKWLDEGPRTLVVATRMIDPSLVIQALDKIEPQTTSDVACGFECQPIEPMPTMVPAKG